VPLYEYQCGRCGRFEVIQKFSDAPLTVCPTCGQEVQKLLSAPAIQFKGTGWYITDYARKSSGGEGAKSSGTDGGGAKGKDAGASKDGAKDTGGSGGASSSGSSDRSSSDKSPAAKSGSGSS
jgi:putative FmdB family regulatory protein